MSATVGPSDTQHGLLLECRIGRVCIKSYENALDRFEVFGCNNVARHLHRVDYRTRREAVSVVAERVTFIVVADGIAEINRISGVGFKRIQQLYFDIFACGFDLRCL